METYIIYNNLEKRGWENASYKQVFSRNSTHVSQLYSRNPRFQAKKPLAAPSTPRPPHQNSQRNAFDLTLEANEGDSNSDETSHKMPSRP